jgi:serine/threonine protein kinase
MAKPDMVGSGRPGPEQTDRSRSGKYTTLMELGSGGTATVSAAVSTGIAGFSKVVVLKTIRAGLGRDESTVKMFLSEARLSARMNHPNVVQVYEVFKQGNLPVIVMEYLDGQSLATLLSRCGSSADFSTELGIAILAKTLAGLHYAHTLVDYSGEPLQLVHRDVSPHNVMIGYDGQVKLVDFGLAKLKKQSEQTITGVIKGKLCYMAPEQIHNQVDHRADIFAVGVMLWEILARQRLWGDAGDAVIISRLLEEDIPRLRDVLPDVDPELEWICSKALAPDPEHRYACAADMQDDLEAYLERYRADVSQQAIGDLLERTCRDLREQTGTELQAKIMALGMSLTDDVDPNEGDEVARAMFRPQRASRLGWLIGVGALGAITGVALAAFPSAQRPADRSAPATAPAPVPLAAQAPVSAEPPPPARPAAPAPPERVTVTISVTPEDARLFLDDRRLASNPFRDTLPRDSLEHTFRAQAEGFEAFEKVLRLESDLDITVSMQSEKATPRVQATTSAQRRSKSAAQRASRPPPVDVASPLPVVDDAPQRSAEPAGDAPPKALVPGEDLRSTRAARQRGKLEFDEPYSQK